MQSIDASGTQIELGIKERGDVDAQMMSLLTGLEQANLEALEFPSDRDGLAPL